MTIDSIRALLNDLESDRVERTISTTNIDKFGQAICAFANDLPDHRQPGYLFLGLFLAHTFSTFGLQGEIEQGIY